MLDLTEAIRIVGVAVASVALLILGDYLGYKVGRWKLAWAGGIVVLAVIIAFTIYAAVVLT